MRKRSLTAAEKNNARKIQAPLSASEFAKLRRKVSGIEYPETNWIGATELIGRVFYLLRAWIFASEEFGPKVGFLLETIEGDTYAVSLTKNEERAEIVRTYQLYRNTHGADSRIGPFTFDELVTRPGYHGYLKMIPADLKQAEPAVSERNPRGRKPKQTEPAVSERNPRGRKPKQTEPIVMQRKPRGRKPKISDDEPF